MTTYPQPKAAAGVSKDSRMTKLLDPIDSAATRGARQEAMVAHKSMFAKDTRMSTAKEMLELADLLKTHVRGYPQNHEGCVSLYLKVSDVHALIAALRTLPSSDQCVAREALERAAKIAENGCLVPPDGGSPTAEEKEMCDGIAKAIRALAVPQAAAHPESIREALTLGRDAVMESFDYVSAKADQDIADARLRSIDAALALPPSDARAVTIEECAKAVEDFIWTLPLYSRQENINVATGEAASIIIRQVADHVRALTNPAPTDARAGE